MYFKLNRSIFIASLNSLTCLGLLLAANISHAGDRLLATGGVMQIEGSAGGGLTPWALIAGYGTREQIGGSAFYTHAETQDHFDMDLAGFAVGYNNRVEISYSYNRFGLGEIGKTLAVDHLRLQTLGAKVRLFGDAVYDQDSWIPQVSVGAQFKHNQDYKAVPAVIGAKKSSGTDFYVSATKLYLDAIAGHNVLVNATLQATKANQFGLLGFGGDHKNSYSLQPAGSVALMLTDNLLIGAEYRARPDNLNTFKEDDAKDVFIAWFPVKNIALTAAYVDLGNIADQDNQKAWYLSGQISY